MARQREINISTAFLSKTHQIVIGNKVSFLSDIEFAYLRKIINEYRPGELK